MMFREGLAWLFFNVVNAEPVTVGEVKVSEGRGGKLAGKGEGEEGKPD